MSDRRITMVIMTRNRREELLETLARMTALPERAPVIVADNASTDGTSEAVTERFGQVRLLRCARNLGAIAEALGGLRWVLRERRVVPPEVEHGLRLLEEPQRHSVARRYVG